MRGVIYTRDIKNPREVFVVECDLEMLTALIKDNEIDPNDIATLVRRSMEAVNAAVLKGRAKAKAEAEEV